MVIEDDLMLQMVYRKLLENYDASVFVCSNVAEAADCFAENEIDLIISDYNLPDGNSVVFLKLIKVWKKQVPMIMITGNDHIKVENPDMDSFVNALMFKPFRPSDFFENVDHSLSLCA